ncbi:hypothetical protein HK097_000075 [Rhizophlyctis rosea]|uniref:Uncharacterized protein n=1 Tax=Rhizophlyctis rosea TaxID=64517 RepID=A0AAD5SLG1_9FUNG|nr:hypothetical protein HK097_000075 [Rhizophlyctis rosea]
MLGTLLELVEQLIVIVITILATVILLIWENVVILGFAISDAGISAMEAPSLIVTLSSNITIDLLPPMKCSVISPRVLHLTTILETILIPLYRRTRKPKSFRKPHHQTQETPPPKKVTIHGATGHKIPFTLDNTTPQTIIYRLVPSTPPEGTWIHLLRPDALHSAHHISKVLGYGNVLQL